MKNHKSNMFKFEEERVKKVLEILNDIEANGLVEDYAIAGGIAAMFYTEPVFTYDLDFFILLKPKYMTRRIITISPISDYLKDKGYSWEGEYIIIEGIPIQFIVVNSDLEKESLKNAEDIMYGQIKTRVLRAEYLIAIFLNAGRKKDFEKIERIIDQSKIDTEFLNKILKRYNLYDIFIKKCLQHLK